MNTAAFASFLHHLLFLFLTLNLVGSIFLWIGSHSCKNIQEQRMIFPIFLQQKVTSAVLLFMDCFFTLVASLAYLKMFITIVGFFGGIYLDKHQLINFATGMAYLFMIPAELVVTRVFAILIETFDEMVREGQRDLFTSSYAFSIKPIAWYHYILLFNADYNSNGWNRYVSGGALNHTYIDYIQITMECCGHRGRSDWDVPIPRSCCSDEYLGRECVLMVAHSRTCNKEYSNFRRCLSSLLVQTIFFASLSFAVALCSMILARLKVKYPDGDYRSEYSSSDDSDLF